VPSEHVEVARALGSFRRERLESELVEIESRIEELKNSDKPVRHEIERLGKRRMTIMRELGLL
jgi:Mg2+ and Co2+ transporter CorA